MGIENLEIIPTLADGTAHYQELVALDGVQYLLRFDYNSRDSFWYLSIFTPDGVPIPGCVGQKLVQNWVPCRLARDSLKPQGALIVSSEEHAEAGLLDLGASTLLSYLPAADLAERSDD